MPWVYILKDRIGRYYIGSTDNMLRRLEQHRRGHTHTTHRMKNPCLVLTQEYDTLFEARIVERKLKKLKRKDYIDRIVSQGYIKISGNTPL